MSDVSMGPADAVPIQIKMGVVPGKSNWEGLVGIECPSMCNKTNGREIER
jgi:hypothetical protein